MSRVIENVDQRTRMVGANRMELLMFHLGGKQHYGINVFKVQEVINCPKLTTVPSSHPYVRGIVSMRGKTISIIDLRMALGGEPIADDVQSYVIVTEYNNSVQGLKICGVDRIVNMNWSDILPPPDGMGEKTYMTAVTHIDKDLVEILDVEKVLAEIVGVTTEVSEDTRQEGQAEDAPRYHVLVADDSVVARKQIARTLEQLGIQYTLVNDGQEALDWLKSRVEHGEAIRDQVSMVISDVEMPRLDGYTLTTQIRGDARLAGLYVLLHSSLSGVFNNHMVKKVGADAFLPKFKADELAKAVLACLKSGKAGTVKAPAAA